MIKRALLSVWDKTGVLELAQQLHEMGIELISTGGTASTIAAAGLPVTNVSDITGFPECLDGRVKTLHPAIHAGVLAIRGNADHMKQLAELKIEPIDMVIINLYPFKATVLKPGVEREECIEKIDIGGPTMLRAAAKNFQDVTVIVDPADYETALAEIRKDGDTSLATKFMLCAKVFEHTAAYDALIADYLRRENNITGFPKDLTLTFERVQEMRYGENPHQAAVFYKEIGARPGSLVEAEQLHGKELSYNNINDTNGALDLLREFKEITVVAVKHANPCGVGSAATVCEAYNKAFEADPVSIFGGILVTNGVMDGDTAKAIGKTFLEIIVAPDFTEEALAVLQKKKNLRLLRLPSINTPLPENAWDMKKVWGGLLVQEADRILGDEEYTVVTERAPTAKELDDLRFAWKLVKHTKSNGIAIAKDGQSLGIGPGQVNRIWAAVQAIERSGEKVKNAALASDAFFPFEDCVEVAAKAGITAIIQPGGSVNDELSIAKCNENGITMIFTGVRHFKH